MDSEISDIHFIFIFLPMLWEDLGKQELATGSKVIFGIVSNLGSLVVVGSRKIKQN